MNNESKLAKILLACILAPVLSILHAPTASASPGGCGDIVYSNTPVNTVLYCEFDTGYYRLLSTVEDQYNGRISTMAAAIVPINGASSNYRSDSYLMSNEWDCYNSGGAFTGRGRYFYCP